MKIKRKYFIVILSVAILATGVLVWQLGFRNNVDYQVDKIMTSIKNLSPICRKTKLIGISLLRATKEFEENNHIDGTISVCIASSVYSNDDSVIDMIVEGGKKSYYDFIITQYQKCRGFIIKYGDKGTDSILKNYKFLVNFIKKNNYNCL